MNFVAIPTEDLHTGSETTAFIGSTDAGVEQDTLRRSIQTRNDPPSASSDSEGKISSVKGVKRKRKTKSSGYSTRVQQGRKAEIEALRSRIAELEMHVERLKKMRSSFGDGEFLNKTNEADQSVWRKAATLEYQDRQRSEENNRKLKAIFTHQQKLDATLRQILGKRVLAQTHMLTNCSTATIMKLENEVAMLYLDSVSQFPVGSSSKVSMSIKTKRNSVHGDSVEMLSTTPLPCPVDSAAQLVWKDLTTNLSFAQCQKGRQPNSYVKNWVIILEGALENKQIKGVQFLRKYEEPNRVVIVKSGIITLPNDGLQFRDQCWMTITRSDTSPNASVVQGCGRIFLDSYGTNSDSESECFARNTAALKSLGYKLREKAQLLQNRLIDGADS
ncbi:hypothetical protein JG687_00007339 [Phytophthora cactorum]|uniref:Uncharacterized protein n=1 Tax=Phytophthora cactorum TaxID=29920 RepID=A0A8T1UHQ6_9STRA|nr:hypothetical protein JG687_00007339 [Phytophthora cactorum]